MPGNYPEENTQHTEHGESLNSRILHLHGEKTAITDAGELPRRKYTTYRTRRKFEIKNTSPPWGENCNNRCRGITQKKIHNIQNTAKV